MVSSTDWFEYCRQFSPQVRALQARDRRLGEVLDCDDCQGPDGYSPCPVHPEIFQGER